VTITPNYVQIPPNSSGLKIDTSEVTTAAGNVVERQNIVIADPTNPLQIADITMANALAVDLSTMQGVNLTALADELRWHSALLEALLTQLGGLIPAR
jgi:hypothetical protein